MSILLIKKKFLLGQPVSLDLRILLLLICCLDPESLKKVFFVAFSFGYLLQFMK